MTDHDRLELDEHGRVVGSTAVVDLETAEDLASTPVQRWVDDVAAPWVSRHRRAMRVGAGVAAVAVVAGLLWSSRPVEVTPSFAVDIDNAVLAGNSIGGPEISPDGVLSVAFVVTGRAAGQTVAVTGLVGPGLGSSTAVLAPPVVDGVQSRVELRAQVLCSDTALAESTPADPSAGLDGRYALTAVARTTPGGGVVQGSVPLLRDGRPVTLLGNAVADWCLAQISPTAAVVDDVTVTPVPGTTLLDLAVTVRNVSGLPLSFATAPRDGGRVALDRSPTSTVAPGGTAVLPTRADVLDCLVPPSLPPAPDVEADAGTLTLTLGLGDRTRLESYAVPAGSVVAQQLAQACATARRVEAGVSSTDLRRSGDGWSGTVVLGVRTAGIGVTAGLERFAEPGTGASGPVLVTGGEGWAVPPSSLSGGAGRLPVAFSGESCRAVAGLAPTTVPLRVLMADGTVVPYAVLVDDVAVLRAVARACGVPVGPGVATRGWRSAA